MRSLFFYLVLGKLVTGVLVGTVSADTWRVDHSASHLGFVVLQGAQRIEGAFERFTADIVFDPLALEESMVDVVIDMSSAHTDDSTHDTTMHHQAWLDVKSHPHARFTTKRFRHRGENRYEVEAILTLRDITREVILPFTLDIVAHLAEMHGRLSIVRTDFDVGRGPWASGTIVSLTVDIVVDLVARRER